MAREGIGFKTKYQQISSAWNRGADENPALASWVQGLDAKHERPVGCVFAQGINALFSWEDWDTG